MNGEIIFNFNLSDFVSGKLKSAASVEISILCGFLKVFDQPTEPE